MHQTDELKFDFFNLFLDFTIQGVNKYKDIVDEVLVEAHQLATGEKDYYIIDRNNYCIITFLTHEDHTFFAQLTPNQIDHTAYCHCKDLIEERNSF